MDALVRKRATHRAIPDTDELGELNTAYTRRYDADLESACAGVGDAEEVVKPRLGGSGGSLRSGRGDAAAAAAGRRPHTARRMIADRRARPDRVGRSATCRAHDQVQRRTRSLALYTRRQHSFPAAILRFNRVIVLTTLRPLYRKTSV